MSERQYDPIFASGNRTHTMMDVYREHHAQMANCYCPACWMAKMVIRQREAESEDTRPA